MLVVDSSFRTLAMEPEQPIGIDSWDRILQGEAPQHHDLKQAEAMIENFSARNLTGLQTVPYTEPDGRPVRRMVGPVVAPADGRNCGGLEVLELDRPFTPEDDVLAQRMGQTVILSMPFPSLLQLDLDDAAVRNVLRTGCILLEYYQGAF